MQLRKNPTCEPAVFGLGAAQRHAVKKGENRRRPPVQHAGDLAIARVHRRGTLNAGTRQMLHQSEIERQVGGVNPHLVECEDVRALDRLQIIIRVRDAFGDAFEDMRLAQRVSREEDLQLFKGDVGIDGHALCTLKRARQPELDVFAGDNLFLHGQSIAGAKSRDDLGDKNLRRGGAGGERHDIHAVKLGPIDLAGILDQSRAFGAGLD